MGNEPTKLKYFRAFTIPFSSLLFPFSSSFFMITPSCSNWIEGGKAHFLI